MRSHLVGLAFLAVGGVACTVNACVHERVPAQRTEVSDEERAPPPASEPVWFDAQGRAHRESSLRASTSSASDPGPTRSSTASRISNARSPLGMNLANVDYVSREWAFVDAFRMGGPWVSRTWHAWEDGRKIPLDADGWPTSLQGDQLAATLVPTLGGGRYVLTYEGEGRIVLDGERTVLSSVPGRIEFEVKKNSQVVINIEKTNPLHPVRLIRVVPQNLAGRQGAPAFHPLFLERLKGFSVLRFMDWGRTNGSKVSRWSERTRPEEVFQTSERGVAYEHMIDLANATGAHPWFTVPHKADAEYHRELATLVAKRLDPSLKVYIEYSNEVWNDAPAFTQSAWLRSQAAAAKLHRDPYTARLMLQGKKSAALFAVFEEVLGGKDRLVRVLGSQIGAAGSHETLVKACDCQADVIAVAPYFGGQYGGADMEGALVKNDVTWLMKELETKALPQLIDGIQASARAAKKLSVRLIAYEGGQHLVAHPAIHNNDDINQRMDGANQHPGMKALYLKLLDAWREAGGHEFVHYSFASMPTKWGRWGSLVEMDQPRQSAPKYDALLTFIEGNPRWW